MDPGLYFLTSPVALLKSSQVSSLNFPIFKEIIFLRERKREKEGNRQKQTQLPKCPKKQAESEAKNSTLILHMGVSDPSI